MIHYLKIKSNFLDDIITNRKTFEIRKDDRNFLIGDLISFIPLGTGFFMCKNKGFFLYEITYKLNHGEFPEGLKKNYCILGIRKVDRFIK